MSQREIAGLGCGWIGEDDLDFTPCYFCSKESNGPTDAYAAIARADRLTQEPKSIRKWREEQKKRLHELGRNKNREKANKLIVGL